MNLNILDMIILLTLAIFAVLSYRRGLIITLFNLLSTVISIALSYMLYPSVSAFIKTNTGIPEKFKSNVIELIGLDEIVTEQTRAAQTELIGGLKLPEFLKDSLLENNNPESYKILDVSGIEEYIGGYISDILINILAMVTVFLLVFIIMKVLANTLNIFSKLPGVNSMNKLGGVIAGLFQGTIVIWIGLMIASFFASNPKYVGILELIETSALAKYFYDTNILFNMVLKLIPV